MGKPVLLMVMGALLIGCGEGAPRPCPEPTLCGNPTDRDFVPDEETAIMIAVAVWSPIYGYDQIRDQAPFIATSQQGQWHVHGCLPEGSLGGVAEITIDRKSARVINVCHGK